MEVMSLAEAREMGEKTEMGNKTMSQLLKSPIPQVDPLLQYVLCNNILLTLPSPL